ncbi:hypothetical protein Acsp04_63830 [Actinomadura sp. NBRC 104425]|uniref:hypothetical protein n=1 Tax=Actinomadura sp. NBRC 104425 TaxID=3032204 RepID=UPI0024A1C94A|nr:hypothetical protein [Actinomadura sp. NBRC 104425]GLZ16148.1 hypothetical protein Acsp04_63830 [Actinomadura sp. NBRC 104425]
MVTGDLSEDVGRRICVRIGGRSVLIRRCYPDVWNAFDDDTGGRPAIAVDRR